MEVALFSVINWPCFQLTKTSDQDAFLRALTVLRSGGVLAMAPEGTRSRSGGLGKGRTGMIRLAIQAHAPILPMAMYGQDQVMRSCRRLRRAPIHVHIGQPIDLPADVTHPGQVRALADEVMAKLAALLPSEYQGEYSSTVPSIGQDCHGSREQDQERQQHVTIDS